MPPLTMIYDCLRKTLFANMPMFTEMRVRWDWSSSPLGHHDMSHQAIILIDGPIKVDMLAPLTSNYLVHFFSFSGDATGNGNLDLFEPPQLTFQLIFIEFGPVGAAVTSSGGLSGALCSVRSRAQAVNSP